MKTVLSLVIFFFLMRYSLRCRHSWTI